MRVVDVTSFFSDTCGGIKTYYREKARWLPRLGFECHFVVPGRQAGQEPLENVRRPQELQPADAGAQPPDLAATRVVVGDGRGYLHPPMVASRRAAGNA